MNRNTFIGLIVVILTIGYFYNQFSPDLISTVPGDKDNAESITEKMSEATLGSQKSGVHLEAMDSSTKATDDFYQYSNGKWLNETEIPAIYSGYTVYHEVNETVTDALKKIVQKSADNLGEKGSESYKVGAIYNSYMDQDTINAIGISAIKNELTIAESIRDKKSLISAVSKLSKLGISVPFRTSVYPDLKDSTLNAIYFSQSGLTLSNRDYYLDLDNKNFDKARNALPIYIKDILMATGKTAEQATKAAQDIVAMETAIAKVQWDKVKNRDNDATYNPYLVSELNELGTNIDWNDVQETLGFNAVDRLIINQPSYFEALDNMFESESIDTWRNYLTYRVLDSRAHHLDEKTAEIRFNFRSRILRGQEEPRPRWKRGISLINGLVGEVVGKLYVEEYFPPAAKAKMMELVDNVINTLDSSIDDLEWMGPETKVKAKEKLSKFTPKIGYPDVWTDYSSLKIVEGDHLANLRAAVLWSHNRKMAKLGLPVDKTEWQMNAQTVNAYYDPTKNEIVFPAARLQPPFFQLDADDAINYGAVGGVIGHEISHGFDDQGSKFDGDENMVDWWTESDRVGFEKKTKALIEQYNKFSPIEGMTVNGAFTLGENIGDLSGVAMAYRAYVNSLKGKEAPVIDGLTGAQRFFIGYAMSRKGKYKDATTISRLASDPHSPLKYRVNGPYRNIDAFHEAFATKEGDGMWLAPGERVRIW